MRKRYVQSQNATSRAEEQPGAYTGATINLGGESAPRMAPKRHQCAGSHFPYWMLWLIWPLIGMIKAVAPVVMSNLAAVGELLMLALPVLLVVVGIALLRRS